MLVQNYKRLLFKSDLVINTIESKSYEIIYLDRFRINL